MEKLKEFTRGEKVQIKPTLTDYAYGGLDSVPPGSIGHIKEYEYWDPNHDSYRIMIRVKDIDDDTITFYMTENELIKAEDF